MFDALTITADVADDERAEAVGALRQAGITVELERFEAREVVTASFVHDGTRPTPDAWEPLEERVRSVLAAQGVQSQAVSYGITSR